MTPRDPQHVRRRGSSQFELPQWATYAVMALFIVIVLVLAFVTFNAVKNVIAGMPGAPEPGGPTGGGSQTGGQPSGQTGDGGGTGSSDVPAWDGGRVTILLMGI